MIKVDVWKDVLRILDSYLEMNNHRKTPERYTILKAIYNTEGHFTLDELGEKLIADYNFPVSRATLYNTLNLFLQLRQPLPSDMHRVRQGDGGQVRPHLRGHRLHPPEALPQGRLHALHLRHLQHLLREDDQAEEQSDGKIKKIR